MHKVHALLLLLLATTPAGASYRLIEVAEGVYAALQPHAERFNDANSAVIVNDRDVVVVDAPASPVKARELLAQIRRLTDKPVRYLVNTHWHGDHTQTNYVFRDAYPDLEIVAHGSHRQDIPERAAPALGEEVERYEAGIAAAEERLQSGIDEEGEPLSAEAAAALPDQIERARRHLENLREIELVPPTLTVDDRLVLHRGARTIEILHFRAHTRGDLVLFLPREKVLVTGDLLDDLPYGGHGYPSSWIAALEALEQLDFTRVISGHGDIQNGKDQLVLVRDLLRSVVQQVSAAAEGTRPLEAVQERVELERFREALVDGDPEAAEAFDPFLAPLVERAFLEARGELE